MARSLWRRARASVIVHNALALYGVHAAGLILPLVTVPFLARVLRPEGWGLVVFAQAFAGWLGLVLEYGFYLSGTRRVARARGDREQVAAIVADVMGAKALLLGAVTAVAFLAYLLVPSFQRSPAHIAWAWTIAVAFGFSPLWFFQGIERMTAPAALEVSARVAATASIFLFVRAPEDGWMVLAAQGVTGLAWVVVGTGWIYRSVPPRLPSLEGARTMLRESASIFVFRGASGIYTHANSFLLGLYAAPQAVAIFAGGERIIRAAVGLIEPASRAIFPRVSHLVTHDRHGASALLRLSLVAVGALGLAMGVVAGAAAPLLVRVLLGPGYEAAVPVLRLLALLPPIIALGTVLGIQWAIPAGHERAFTGIVVAAGALNLLLVALLAPTYGATGVAVSVVLAEGAVAISLVGLALRHGRTLWSTTETPMLDVE